MKIVSNSLKQTQEIASALAKCLKPGDVVALIGNLGSGKTAFVKGLVRGLGISKSKVLSPTFVLMRQYPGRITVNHFDLYRLKDIQQLREIGYEEYFYSYGITVIEWADRIKEALPEEYLEIGFDFLDKNSRRIKFRAYGKRYEDNLRAFKRKTDIISR